MAKKVSKVFKADLKKNNVKGGAWMAVVSVQDEGIDLVGAFNTSAWANALAGKRWIKEQVLALTPRKSIKMIAGSEVDAKGRPTSFSGELVFKA